MQITSVAEAVEVAIANRLESLYEGKTHPVFGNPFKIPMSTLYGIDLTSSGEVIDVTQLDANPDVYALLSTPASTVNSTNKTGYTTWALVTTGWAAPLNSDGIPDGAPSEHPRRRRVRLVVTANMDGVASVLRFEESPLETIVDPGQATGSLNDAVMEFVSL